jgi:hypothetical protein
MVEYSNVESVERLEPTKYYHIYLKDECILNNLKEEKFKESWEILNNLVGLIDSEYSEGDLSYVQVFYSDYGTEESSY